MKQEIVLIYARAANGVIGKAGALPWHLPQDLQHFKALTMGQDAGGNAIGLPMIMGRKTFDSLPGLLPKRRHIVLTRNDAWQGQGAEIAHDVEEALALAANNAANNVASNAGGAAIGEAAGEAADEAADDSTGDGAGKERPQQVAIIGGAAIYDVFFPLAHRVEMTQIHREYAGDTFMQPPMPSHAWRETAREDHPETRSSKGKLQPAFSFIRYERAEKSSGKSSA